MKIISIILAFALFISGLRPCKERFSWHDDGQEKEESSCHVSKEKHACCLALAGETNQKDQNHSEDSPCCDYCFCNVPIIATNAHASLSNTTIEPKQRKLWVRSTYSQEFTHLIWQPPRIA